MHLIGSAIAVNTTSVVVLGWTQGNRIKMLFLGDMEKFEEITSALDPRVKGRCKHKVSDIIIIAIATYLCGGDDYISMYELCRERGEDLKPLVELPNGCPSVDTFERVISRIDPKAFGACLSVFGDRATASKCHYL